MLIFSRRGSLSILVLGICATLLFATSGELALAEDRQIILHPKCEKLPTELLGPFVKLKDGAVLAVDTTQAHLSRDDGQTWTSYPLFKNDSIRASFERAALCTKDGTVLFAYCDDHEAVVNWDVVKNEPGPGMNRSVYVIRSLDNGKTWDEPRRVQDGYCGALRHMIQLRSGRIVLGSQEIARNPGRHVTLTFASDDDGKTWIQSNVIDLGREGGYGSHGGAIESTLAELSDGRVWLLIRTPRGFFYQAFSTDEGLTWTDIGRSSIEASAAPGMLIRLQSGRLALFWNRWVDAERKLGRREQLSFALSEDDGKTWSPPAIVAKDPTAPDDKGPEHRLSYPYVYEHRPGELWVTTGQGKLRMKVHETDFLPTK